jgi:hypothetical protein
MQDARIRWQAIAEPEHTSEPCETKRAGVQGAPFFFLILKKKEESVGCFYVVAFFWPVL